MVKRVLALWLGVCAIAPVGAHAGLTFSGCVRDNEAALDCGATAPALGGARGLALAPGGNQLYVASQDDASVATFGVDTTSGALGFQRCVQSSSNRNGTSGECGTSVVEGLQYDTSIVLSPDGRFAYTGGERITEFNRDVVTGALTRIGCVDRGGPSSPCAAHSPAMLSGVNGLAISPDGDSVYATTDGFTGGSAPDPANHHSALLVLARDAPTGLLSDGGCVMDAGAPLGCATTAPGLLGPLGVAVSPGNDSVYVASRDTNAVSVLSRATAPPHALAATGCIMQAGSGTGCASTGHGLTRPSNLVVAPDGRTLTVTTDQGRTAVLTRAATGALSFSGCIGGPSGISFDDVCADAPLGGAAGEFLITPDGRNAYAGGRDFNALTVYSRDPATGFLAFVECFRDTITSSVPACTRTAPALHSAGQMQASADGRFLYVAIQGAFTNEGGVLTFARTADALVTPKPTAPKTVPAPKASTLSLPITCPTGATDFCTGEVVVTPSGATAAKRRKPLARVRIARATTHGRLRLKLHLPRAQRHRGARLTVRITRRNASGTRTTVTRHVRLR